MFRLYFGLVLTGLTAVAHATDDKSAGVLTAQADQSIIRFVSSGTDYPSPYKVGDGVVVRDRAADVASGRSAFGSASDRNAKPENEMAGATNARWSGSYADNRLLSLARHKRVEFTADQYKVTLRQDSALIETGNLKIALRSGSTSMQWSKAL